MPPSRLLSSGVVGLILLASYFAEMGTQGVVLRVIVATQAVIDSGRWGDSGKWVQTYDDGSQRGIYAAPGRTYEPLGDAFTTSALADATLDGPIQASDSRLTVSDNPAVSVRAGYRLSLLRPIDDGAGFKYAAPNSRLRFVTDSSAIELGIRFTKLTTHGAFQDTAEILADGSSVATFTPNISPDTVSSAVSQKVSVNFGSSATRTIEVLWPYADSMDFVYLRVKVGATVSAAAARPSGKICVLGDSITQGFYATKPSESWAYKLGVAKGRQVINLGYGGRRAIASDGLAIDPSCGAIVYMIGTNDFLAQVAVSTFQSAVLSALVNMRSVNPTARIYMVSPLYMTATGTIPITSYRSAIASAVTSFADANAAYVDGLTLMTNSASRLQDTVHPNVTGAAEISAALAAIVQ